MEEEKLTMEYGRYQLQHNKAACLTALMIENVHREDDFWLPVYAKRQTGPKPLIGHLKFRKVGGHLFELCELRPANAPLLDEAGLA